MAHAGGDMRRVSVLFVLLFAGVTQSFAAPSPKPQFGSIETVQQWIYGYRAKATPAQLPDAVRAMSKLGAFKDPESSGIYIGFVAGVLGTQQGKAEHLIGKMLPLPQQDEWAIVRAIAYSGLTDWKGVLRKFRARLPTRQVMIDKYLSGELQTLEGISVEKSPTVLQRMRGYMDVGQYFRERPKNVKVTFDSHPELLDTLWGYYFATGAYSPIARIITTLPWATDRDSVEKLTVGSMAKYTLASNASRDAGLLKMLKWAKEQQQPKEVVPVLTDVIDAAEMMDTVRLRKQALASIEELKRKGPGYRRELSFWGQVGQGAIALGCIGAAVAGQVEFGLPCVIGGAASSAVLNFWNGQQQ
jgi:hypothetical protein